MGSFSIWHWLVVLIIVSPIVYGIYRSSKRSQRAAPDTVAPLDIGGKKMFCPQCGNANDISSKFCTSCGTALPQVAQRAPTPSGKETLADDPVEFYKAIVGPKHQDYYLRHFAGFDARGKITASWHWPAFFVTLYWFLYRKMWLNALIYFCLPYVFVILLATAAVLAGKSGETVIGVGYVLYIIGLFVVPGLYANALYYKHCKKKITEVKASPNERQRQLGELSGKGGTSAAAFIVIIPILIAVIGILAAIAVPAYQDYTTRARMTEAVSIGTQATQSVGDYFDRYQRVPASLEETGFAAQFSPFIKAVDVDSRTGVVMITIAGAPLTGKTLYFVPSLTANQQILWKCQSDDIQDKYLPQQCRRQK